MTNLERATGHLQNLLKVIDCYGESLTVEQITYRDAAQLFLQNLAAESSESSAVGLKKYDPLWNDLNSLLSFLTSYGTVEKLVKDYYAQFNNDAPSWLLRNYIDKLQKRLDEASS